MLLLKNMNVAIKEYECCYLLLINPEKKRSFDDRKQEIKQVYKTSHKTRARARDYNIFLNFCQYVFKKFLSYVVLVYN